jgi:hypothetical protein
MEMQLDDPGRALDAPARSAPAVVGEAVSRRFDGGYLAD